MHLLPLLSWQPTITITVIFISRLEKKVSLNFEKIQEKERASQRSNLAGGHRYPYLSLLENVLSMFNSCSDLSHSLTARFLSLTVVHIAAPRPQQVPGPQQWAPAPKQQFNMGPLGVPVHAAIDQAARDRYSYNM